MSIETIYMGLLNEGTDVWRPVQAERLSDGRYKTIGPIPESEFWEFPPGSVVQIVSKRLHSGVMSVAVSGE